MKMIGIDGTLLARRIAYLRQTGRGGNLQRPYVRVINHWQCKFKGHIATGESVHAWEKRLHARTLGLHIDELATNRRGREIDVARKRYVERCLEEHLLTL